MSFIDAHNENPIPYGWVKSTEEILESIRKFCLKANELCTGENDCCEL